MLPILVLKDSKTRLTSWIPVGSKGCDPYATARFVEFVEFLGYRRLFLKSDCEAALVALKKAVKSKLVDYQITLEESPPYEPQANGEIEKQVHLMQENTRVQLCQLVDSLGVRIPENHPAISWLVNYSAFLYCIKSPHRDDGRTPYMRHKLRTYGKKVFEFGEGVQYRKRGQTKLDTRFTPGIYVGCRLVDEQHLVADSATGEIYTVRDVKQRPEETRFSVEEFNKAIVKCSYVGTPPKSSMSANYSNVAMTQRELIAPKYKSFQCKQEYFQEYGYSAGCPGCRFLKSKIDGSNIWSYSSHSQ
jgi:hypothetical protein